MLRPAAECDAFVTIPNARSSIDTKQICKVLTRLAIKCISNVQWSKLCMPPATTLALGQTISAALKKHSGFLGRRLAATSQPKHAIPSKHLLVCVLEPDHRMAQHDLPASAC